MTATKMTKSAREAQEFKDRAALEELCPRGSTVYCILRHRARSGMTRVIDLYVIRDGDLRRISSIAARFMEWRYDERHEGIRVGGCGFDAGYQLVYDLSTKLYGRDASWGYDREGAFTLRRGWL